MDGKIYIVAGQQRHSRNTNKVTVFDPAANYGYGRWADVPGLSLPFAYEGVSAKVIGNTLIYTHGGRGISQNTQKDTYTRTIVPQPGAEAWLSVAVHHPERTGRGERHGQKPALYH
jgi:hypothetical protein